MSEITQKHTRSIIAKIIIREKLAIDLSEEIGMDKNEAIEVINFSMNFVDQWPVSYMQLKEEIKSYIIINMLSLVTKFQ